MSQRRGRISARAVAVYRRMLELRVPGDNLVQLEPYWECCRELDHLMQREPWQTTILDVLDDDEQPFGLQGEKLAEWSEALAISRALKEAAAKRE